MQTVQYIEKLITCLLVDEMREDVINVPIIDFRLNSKQISEEVFKRIRPVGSSRPQMYGLPKVHKPSMPLRPILSMLGSPQ